MERAATEFGEANEVLPRWWTIIGSDEQISFSDLVDYYLALAPLDGTTLRDQAAAQINRLGLLPDPGFFDSPGEKQLRKRLDDNRTLALRLANFSEEDRQKVDKALAAETDTDRRAELRTQLRDLQEYRRGGQLGLTAADATATPAHPVGTAASTATASRTRSRWRSSAPSASAASSSASEESHRTGGGEPSQRRRDDDDVNDAAMAQRRRGAAKAARRHR